MNKSDYRPTALRLVEAMSVAQKWRELDRLVERGRSAVAKAFVAQGRLFVRAFGEMRPYFVEAAITPPQPSPQWEGGRGLAVREAAIPDDVWLRLWGDVSAEMLRLMLAPVLDLNEMGLLLGAGAMAATLGIDFEKAFSLKNPRAVAYLEEHGAALVTKINEETRSQMKTLVTQAVDEGWSYNRAAKAIRAQFDDFAGLKPQKHIRDRATLVAVTEAGQAYEAGSQQVALGLADVGISMEKYWHSVGDDRVSQGCRDNEAAGWIAMTELFPSGHARPLRFPGCRCTAQYRKSR